VPREGSWNAEQAAQRSQGFLNAHDCAGLKRYLAQQTTGATATARATAVVEDAVARCTSKGQPSPGGARPPAGKGSGGLLDI
jgi:hypothetical protein